MKVIALITEHDVIDAILKHLAKTKARPPPAARRARRPSPPPPETISAAAVRAGWVQ